MSDKSLMSMSNFMISIYLKTEILMVVDNYLTK